MEEESIMFGTKKRKIVEFVTGSNLYGTATAESDVDTRGVFLAPEECYLGFLDNIKILKPGDGSDTEYHELSSFAKLALDNNPNIIEYLFVPPSKWIKPTKAWESIVERTPWFISKKAKFTFSGYAHSQFLRIKRHRGWLMNPPKKQPKRSDYGLIDGESAISKNQIGAFNVMLAMHLEEIRIFHPLVEQLMEMEETKIIKAIIQEMKATPKDLIKTVMPVSDNFLEALEREKAYQNAMREWTGYQNWKDGRNPKRAELEAKFGWDTKHGAHLVRLMYEGEELLTKGKITFPRPEASLLLDIQHGAWTYDDLMQYVEDYDAKFNKLYETSKLPKEPDRVGINLLVINLIRQHINSPSVYQDNVDALASKFSKENIKLWRESMLTRKISKGGTENTNV